VAFAFSCNATRVATIQIGDGTDETNGGSGTAIPQALDWHTKIDRLRMGTFKYLLDKWSTWSTADGPLFDHAFALWTTTSARDRHTASRTSLTSSPATPGPLEAGSVHGPRRRPQQQGPEHAHHRGGRAAMAVPTPASQVSQPA
jgi:hypothetical protein